MTFVYRGAAEAVHLRHWIYGLPATQPFAQRRRDDLWVLRIELPENSRIEYKLEIARDGRDEWIQDPLNPLQAARSVRRQLGRAGPRLRAAGRGRSPTRPRARARSRRSCVHSAALGGERHVGVYLPARFRRTRHYPLLVVHDGNDYLHYADLQAVLDNLIHRLEIPPLDRRVHAVARPARASTPARRRTRASWRASFRTALAALVPAARRAPAARCLMGASFGAVASLHAAWRYPGVLRPAAAAVRLVRVHRHRHAPPRRRCSTRWRVRERVPRRPGRPAERVFVTCGIYESLIYENRSLVPLLQSTGMEVRYVEARDGHNWENWRDRLREGSRGSSRARCGWSTSKRRTD